MKTKEEKEMRREEEKVERGKGRKEERKVATRRIEKEVQTSGLLIRIYNTMKMGSKI